MAIRDQGVEIGNSIQTITRIVYDDRSYPELMLQTGYVEYDTNEIPVWRPYIPEESGLDAKWRNGIWKNIYKIRMLLRTGVKHVSYELSEHNENGLVVRLPRVELILSHDIRQHFMKLKDR